MDIVLACAMWVKPIKSIFKGFMMLLRRQVLASSIVLLNSRQPTCSRSVLKFTSGNQHSTWLEFFILAKKRNSIPMPEIDPFPCWASLDQFLCWKAILATPWLGPKLQEELHVADGRELRLIPRPASRVALAACNGLPVSCLVFPKIKLEYEIGSH